MTEPSSQEQPSHQHEEEQSVNQSVQAQLALQPIVLKFHKAHNIRACLDYQAPGCLKFKEIIEFLVRSRIHKAITADVTVFRQHQESFWKKATIDNVEKPTRIISRVASKVVVVTEDVIRQTLGFGDSASDPVDLNMEKVKGCMLRCGYPEIKGSVVKKHLCPPFKYLAHVLIHCLGSKKSGYDTMSQTLQNAFVALILNMKFNFSKMIFDYIVDCMLGRIESFVLYPRFLQLIFNHQIEGLQGAEGDILMQDHMDPQTLRTMEQYALKDPKPADVKLFGHLIDVEYVCPPGNTWINPGETSEVNVAVEILQPKEKRKGKSLEDVGIEVKRRKPLLVIKERPRYVPETAPVTSTVPPPTSTHTGPPPEDTTVATSSARTSEQLAALNRLVVSLMADFDKQKQVVEKLEAEKDEWSEEKRKMKEEIDELRAVLVVENSARKEIEGRLKIMEECYDDLAKQLTVNAVDDDDGDRRIDESGSGAGRS